MPDYGGDYVNIKVKLSLKGNLQYFNREAGDIVEIPFEDYLKGVVSAEVGNASLEACRAQAVAARSFAYPSARDGKVITDTGASDQAFIAARISNRSTYPNAHQGVEDTTGQILTYQGKPIGKSAHYSSANNGTTKNRKYKWPSSSDVPYLVMKPDHWTWQEIQLREAAGQKVRYGHGVGMSQYGAMYAGRQGISYREILAFYFPGCEIVNPSKPVEMPAPLPPPVQALEKPPAIIRAEKMAEYARSKVGGKYVFGASGPINFDCSGFVKRIGQLLGLDLYHGATTMWLRGFQEGNAKQYNYWSDSGTIDTMPLNKTVILFNQDKTETRRVVMAHTGFYDAFTGNVIQAGGYGGRGVHENPLDRRRWTHWAIFKGTDTEGSEIPMATILRRGSAGAQVKTLQAALINLKYDLGKWGADGKYGAKTETAVMAFQRLSGVPVTGAWSSVDQAALERALNPVSNPEAGTSSNAELIAILERALEIAKG